MNKYNLYLDGEKIGDIINSEKREFEIPAGHHVLRTNTWYYFNSRSCEFTIHENEIKTFNLRISKTGQLVPLLFYPIAFLAYLAIRYYNSSSVILTVLLLDIAFLIYWIRKMGNYLKITEEPSLSTNNNQTR